MSIIIDVAYAKDPTHMNAKQLREEFLLTFKTEADGCKTRDKKKTFYKVVRSHQFLQLDEDSKLKSKVELINKSINLLAFPFAIRAQNFINKEPRATQLGEAANNALSTINKDYIFEVFLRTLNYQRQAATKEKVNRNKAVIIKAEFIK